MRRTEAEQQAEAYKEQGRAALPGGCYQNADELITLIDNAPSWNETSIGWLYLLAEELDAPLWLGTYTERDGTEHVEDEDADSFYTRLQQAKQTQTTAPVKDGKA